MPHFILFYFVRIRLDMIDAWFFCCRSRTALPNDDAVTPLDDDGSVRETVVNARPSPFLSLIFVGGPALLVSVPVVVSDEDDSGTADGEDALPADDADAMASYVDAIAADVDGTLAWYAACNSSCSLIVLSAISLFSFGHVQISPFCSARDCILNNFWMLFELSRP
ncbi:hypothetical protein BC940DRAFT_287616 [Gongronella butleri]|nr:hypothetical protein BC940DRAFT_287616 [Gongronella butleri]